MRVTLFIPCFLDQCAPQVAGAVAEVLDRLGCAWDYPPNQTCCGQFALTLGDVDTAHRLSRHFLRVFGDSEAVLCPSASCTWTVRHHYPLLAESERERRELEGLVSRVFELSEWLVTRRPLPWVPGFTGRLALHRSCKSQKLGALSGAKWLLSQVPGLELMEVSPSFSCCGFGGVFKVQRPELSRAIGAAYLDAVRATGASGLVSLDYSCLLHLREVAQFQDRPLELFHLAELFLT